VFGQLRHSELMNGVTLDQMVQTCTCVLGFDSPSLLHWLMTMMMMNTRVVDKSELWMGIHR
jgi:hypothetical protein